MPTENNQILNCSAYIFPDLDSAERGLRAGGSGFLIQMTCDCPRRGYYGYIVTNKHILENIFISNESAIIRINKSDGELEFFEVQKSEWKFHSTEDLAACFFRASNDSSLNAAFLEAEKTVNQSLFELQKLVGLEVMVVGRFQGLDESVKNSPVVRFGNLSTNELVPIDCGDGNPKPSILAELRTINGFSGSPVIAKLHTNTSTGSNPVMHYFLLGVHKAHLPQKSDVYKAIGRRTEDGLYVKTISGMAAIVPGWHVLDLLNYPIFKTPRDRHVSLENANTGFSNTDL